MRWPPPCASTPSWRTPKLGQVYAYEVDGYGGHTFMDDANVPSLLALPYLGALPLNDPIYQNTRRLALSAANPFFYKGSAAEGIGGPHVGVNMIWPLAIIIRGLTSTDDGEIRACVQTLRATHAGTGYMHESFHKDDPKKFTRAWFAWANTLFGEFLWKVYQERPALLAELAAPNKSGAPPQGSAPPNCQPRMKLGLCRRVGKLARGIAHEGIHHVFG